MSVEGLELRTMVRQLRAEVREAALKAGGHSQVPSYYDQLLGDFFFRPKAAATQTPCDALTKPDAGKDAVVAADLAPAFQACSRAVAEYPSEPRFVHLLYNVQEQIALQKALKSDLPALSEAYLALFPSGRFVAEVRTRLAALSVKVDAAKAISAEAAKTEAAKTEAAKAELARAEAAKAEARAELAKAEAARTAAKADAARAEAARAEAAKAEAKTQEARAEALKMEAAASAARTEAAQAAAAAEAARKDAAKAESARVAASAEAARVAAAPPRVEPATAPAGAPIAIDPTDIARLLQIHLKRVGCEPGVADGQWTSSAQKALEAFNRHAGTTLNAKVASLDALDAVRAKPSRVCPLTCARGQRVEGDKCVAITCEPGFALGADGSCQKRKEQPQPPPVARQESPRSTAPAGGSPGGAKCFTFNGQRFCE
jgi:chemotaxis protein histidine kinase CheA